MPAVPEHLDGHLLGLYLGDHLAGAAGGINRFERLAKTWDDRPFGKDFAMLATEVGEEARLLRETIDLLGVAPRRPRQLAAMLGERAARLVAHGRPFQRSPMGLLLEIEVMRGAVMAKRGLWQTLSDLSDDLDLPGDAYDTLVERSDEQVQVLDRVHAEVRTRAFRVPPARR
ncbi:hypothetical protein [Georgenia faecalis]|uniref:Uncharacterized protein n=1 Tax=Georgenia faecalis TaxID=2483799 RepID=A0ABV9D8I9_9MICO|nr:hypothetical protein [Georgenia faecalis]